MVLPEHLSNKNIEKHVLELIDIEDLDTLVSLYAQKEDTPSEYPDMPLEGILDEVKSKVDELLGVSGISKPSIRYYDRRDELNQSLKRWGIRAGGIVAVAAGCVGLAIGPVESPTTIVNLAAINVGGMFLMLAGRIAPPVYGAIYSQNTGLVRVKDLDNNALRQAVSHEYTHHVQHVLLGKSNCSRYSILMEGMARGAELFIEPGGRSANIICNEIALTYAAYCRKRNIQGIYLEAITAMVKDFGLEEGDMRHIATVYCQLMELAKGPGFYKELADQMKQ